MDSEVTKASTWGKMFIFCRKVNDHKFQVWADPTIELLHVGEYAYGVRDYDAYQDIRKKENIPDEFDGVIK